MIQIYISIYLYMYLSIYLYMVQIIFHYRFLEDIEQSSLYYTVNPFCLSILCTVVCIC